MSNKLHTHIHARAQKHTDYTKMFSTTLHSQLEVRKFLFKGYVEKETMALFMKQALWTIVLK